MYFGTLNEQLFMKSKSTPDIHTNMLLFYVCFIIIIIIIVIIIIIIIVIIKIIINIIVIISKILESQTTFER